MSAATSCMGCGYVSCMLQYAFNVCCYVLHGRRLSYMHAGVTNATQLFNLRLYVCFYVLHESGPRSRCGYCYMHAGASGVFSVHENTANCSLQLWCAEKA